ncbi:MAG: lipid biosynthesis acyltransferase, partial [Burkholderia sp.]|nr:lipid biosynthesis acyltransferase [Burkholderia sp.]
MRDMSSCIILWAMRAVSASHSDTGLMKVLLRLMWVLHWLPLPLLGRVGEAVGALLFATVRSR